MNLKPGWKTSEFWISLLPYVLIFFSKVFGLTFDQNVVAQGITGLFAVITTVAYIWTRVQLKKTAIIQTTPTQ